MSSSFFEGRSFYSPVSNLPYDIVLSELSQLSRFAADEVIKKRAGHLRNTLEGLMSLDTSASWVVDLANLAKRWLIIGEEIYHLCSFRKLQKDAIALRRDFYGQMGNITNFSPSNVKVLNEQVCLFEEKVGDLYSQV